MFDVWISHRHLLALEYASKIPAFVWIMMGSMLLANFFPEALVPLSNLSLFTCSIPDKSENTNKVNQWTMARIDLNDHLSKRVIFFSK